MTGSAPSAFPPDLAWEGVVHDLNNIFETIAEAAALVAADPKWAAVAGIIDRSVERGRRVVASLAQTGEASCDLGAAISGAVQFAGDYFGGGVRFSLSLQPGVPAAGPREDWERAFFNLFLNAGEAMGRRGSIEIAMRRCERSVEIAVADDGPGIPAEILPQIFQPHFSTKPQGSGLGLHIVASIVARHGGTIAACNRQPGPGALFLLRLPC